MGKHLTFPMLCNKYRSKQYVLKIEIKESFQRIFDILSVLYKTWKLDLDVLRKNNKAAWKGSLQYMQM
ncbi:MAG: hypothetical protein BGO70_03300 [Bacteroidetes bacterium 43-93]|nr:MAG: hypothetical protein BGO70_03300 [Bacteroidetes bacterium 43-93]